MNAEKAQALTQIGKTESSVMTDRMTRASNDKIIKVGIEILGKVVPALLDRVCAGNGHRGNSKCY